MVWEQNRSKRSLGFTQVSTGASAAVFTRRWFPPRHRGSDQDAKAMGGVSAATHPPRPASTAWAPCTSAASAYSVKP